MPKEFSFTVRQSLGIYLRVAAGYLPDFLKPLLSPASGGYGHGVSVAKEKPLGGIQTKSFELV